MPHGRRVMSRLVRGENGRPLGDEIIGGACGQRLDGQPGLADPCVGRMLPSQIKRVGDIVAAAKTIDHAHCGIVPIRAAPTKWAKRASCTIS